MTPLRALLEHDADEVAARVGRTLLEESSQNPLVNPAFDATLLSTSLRRSVDPAWVYEENGRLRGHLYGALLADSTSLSAWTGPDGLSFDTPEILRELVEEAVTQWYGRGAREHFVWCLSEPQRVQTLTNLGYQLFSVRGVRRLAELTSASLPVEYSLRRGTSDDIERALELDAVLDEAQGVDMRTLSRLQREANREELLTTLQDPDTSHYVVEYRDRVIGQCIVFPAPPRRGSYEATIHLSEVVIDPHHQRRGVASAMLHVALDEARTNGFDFAETQWRFSNLGATLYWTSHYFEPTYVRLCRTL